MSAPPDLLEARVALRHRSLLDVFDLSLRFLVAHPLPYAILCVVVLGPALAVSLAVAAASGWTAAWWTAVVLLGFARVPFLVLGSRLVFDRVVPIGDVLGAALRALPGVGLLRFVAACAFALGTLIFVLPALWLGSIFLYIDEAKVLERAPVFAAFGRSQRLAGADAGDAFLFFVLFGLLHVGGVFLGDAALRGILGGLLQVTPPPPLMEEGGSVLAMISFWALVPYLSTTRLLAYLNVRTKAEGWDVQTRFARLARRYEADDAGRAGDAEAA